MNTLKSLPGHWFRFNLRALLALFVLIALGLTALKVSSAGWAAATATVTAGVLLFSLLGWIHGRETRRAYWSGFAVCGWGYLALVHIWGGTLFNAAPGNVLASHDALEFMFRKFNPLAEQMWPPQANIFSPSGGYVSPYAASSYIAPPMYAAPTSVYPVVYQAAAPSSPPVYYQTPVAPAPLPNAANATLTPVQTNYAPPDSDSAAPLIPPASYDSPTEAGSTPSRDPGTASGTQSVVPQSSNSTVSARPYLPSNIPDDGGTSTAPSPAPLSYTPGMYPPAPVVYQQPPTYYQPQNLADLEAVQTRARHFPVIGHCLFAILCGWLGAIAASFVATRMKTVPA